MRNFYSGTNLVDWKGSRIILKDRYGVRPTWENLHAFSKGTPPYRHREFKEIRVKEWDDSIPADETTVKKIAAKWGAAFQENMNHPRKVPRGLGWGTGYDGRGDPGSQL